MKVQIEITYSLLRNDMEKGSPGATGLSFFVIYEFCAFYKG